MRARVRGGASGTEDELWEKRTAKGDCWKMMEQVSTAKALASPAVIL